MFEAVRYEDGALLLIDQRRLPGEEIYLRLSDAESVAQAIKDMVVRGAPAIGVAAAYGLALGMSRDGDPSEQRERLARMHALHAEIERAA